MAWTRSQDHAVLAVSAEEFRDAIGVMPRRVLASQLGLASHSFLNALASGQSRGCSPELAEKIEKELGFEPGSLFTVVLTTDAIRYRYPRDAKREAA